ncbi:MAG: hypothetical protein ACREP7_16960 [Lysobacter sp.]
MNHPSASAFAGVDGELPDRLRRLLERELSPAARAGYLALLLVASFASAALVSLWITEPSLPARTHAAFALLLAINLSWSAFAVWALRHRRVLYARHRLVSTRLASAFCAIFSLGAFALAAAGGIGAGWLAGCLGVAMTALALILMVRARRHYTGLQQRRETLERALAQSN